MKDNFWKNKKVIVTGANGFLASHITISLINCGAKVLGIIKKNIPNSLLNIEIKTIKSPKLKIVKGDINNYNQMVKIFRDFKADICFHIAAQAIVGTANNSPVPTLKTNILGTWNILEAARTCSKKTVVVVASSDKAYGEHKKLPYREDASLQSLHPYDASKACADILTRAYANTYGLNTAVTRCANIYGPGDMNFSRIIPGTIQSLFSKKNPVIRSDGTPIRDYIYVDDVVRAYLVLGMNLLKGKSNVKGNAFNFGTGKPINVIGLVDMIIRLSGIIDLKPKILSKVKIHGEIDKQYLSSIKAKKTLGWKADYSLEKGMSKTIDWYKNYLCR
ncbi:MAG: GDP-mannose 4,6-dehydratase [Candidatus Gygaella obscura]|nr:GDP-mannose 4,6-dehydratase [Candidatus Gygaella obscura]